MKVGELFPNGATEAAPPRCEKCGAICTVNYASSTATIRMGKGDNSASVTPKKFQH